MLNIFEFSHEFASFEIEKHASKNSNEEEHERCENEEFNSFERTLFSFYENHFLIFFSTDKSYFYLKRFCRKIFLMTSLIRNDQQYWFWAFFSSQFPDMIYHKVWSIMLEIYSDNCKVTLLFQGKKFHWGILKLGWRWTTISCKNAQIQFLWSFLLSVSLRML